MRFFPRKGCLIPFKSLHFFIQQTQELFMIETVQPNPRWETEFYTINKKSLLNK